ncbi:MAG: OmpA family protein [Flavobacterium sp.]|nr:MAG: OmpA family protein [Flavobacterium sp.]
MRTLLILCILCFCIISCKNTEENRKMAEVDPEEQVATDQEPEIEFEVPEVTEEDTTEESISETKSKSIFDTGENRVYIKKEDLDKTELAALQQLMDGDPELKEKALIKDNGDEIELDLPSLKVHLANGHPSYKSIRDLLEQNVSPASVSMGYEIDGRERIRDFTNNPTGGFLEDMTEYYMYRGGRTGKTALRRLGVASDDNVVPILLAYFEVSEAELEMLKDFPNTENHSNSAAAKRALNFEIPTDVSEYLKDPQCTEGFKYTIDYFKKRQGRAAGKFMQKANKAREEFYKLNPGWYGEEEETGITYIDTRRKYIYLPFGELSFADVVISHDTGEGGSNSDGVLGEPDMALENFRLQDPRIGNLGLNGVLTLEFTNNALTDVNGPDLYVFEMGKIEPTRLEISKDGVTWLDIGKIEGGTAMVDLAGYVKPGETYNYVRLTDLDTFSTVPGADVDAVAAIGGALRLNIDSAVLFDTGEYELKGSATSELERLLEAIKEIPEGTIIVEGHTDNVGSPQSNLTLSKNRAQEVADYLIENLSDTYKFTIKGLGETQPVAANDTDENKQKNRRVEILVLPSNKH